MAPYIGDGRRQSTNNTSLRDGATRDDQNLAAFDVGNPSFTVNTFKVNNTYDLNGSAINQNQTYSFAHAATNYFPENKITNHQNNANTSFSSNTNDSVANNSSYNVTARSFPNTIPVTEQEWTQTPCIAAREVVQTETAAVVGMWDAVMAKHDFGEAYTYGAELGESRGWRTGETQGHDDLGQQAQEITNQDRSDEMGIPVDTGIADGHTDAAVLASAKSPVPSDPDPPRVVSAPTDFNGRQFEEHATDGDYGVSMDDAPRNASPKASLPAEEPSAHCPEPITFSSSPVPAHGQRDISSTDLQPESKDDGLPRTPPKLRISSGEPQEATVDTPAPLVPTNTPTTPYARRISCSPSPPRHFSPPAEHLSQMPRVYIPLSRVITTPSSLDPSIFPVQKYKTRHRKEHSQKPQPLSAPFCMQGRHHLNCGHWCVSSGGCAANCYGTRWVGDITMSTHHCVECFQSRQSYQSSERNPMQVAQGNDDDDEGDEDKGGLVTCNRPEWLAGWLGRS